MKKNSVIIFFSALLSLTAGVNANNHQLQKEAVRIAENLGDMGTDESAIQEAFKLVAHYENTVGPLFMSPATKNGLPRKPKDGMELDFAMFAIQQGLIDQAYTPENLIKFRQTLDGAKFETASYFPGAVAPPTNPNTIETVRINASQPTAWGSPVAWREDAARRPTGCYLTPGSVAVVSVPSSLVDKGYSIRVGAHSWDLIKKPKIKRLDRVSIVYPITQRDTLIANPLGGGIYIEVPYEADAGIVSIALKNVVRAPFFSARSFDKTTLEVWKNTERQHPAPWADFESDKFMMQVPAEGIRNLEDPITLMADWDQAMDAVSELFGYPLVRPKTVLYLQVDVIMRGRANFPGYPQSNYAYDAHHPEEFKQSWMLQGPQYANWTVFHEVGHSQFCSKFRGETEALVNLPHVAVLNRKFGWTLDEAFGDSVNGMKHLTINDVAAMWMVTENFRMGRPMNHSNRPGDEMKYQHRGYGKYIEIANLFGWDALGNFWKEVNHNWQPGDNVPQNQDPVDDRILRLSKAAGADLRPLIHFWGIQPENPEQLAEAIQVEGLKPSREIYDRLQYYKTIIPMDNDAFRLHATTVYPNGFPRHGSDWYKATLQNYSAEDGQAAQAALQEIIDLYFKK